MPVVDVEVNGRVYQIACDDGQEDHLSKLAEKINSSVLNLVSSIGQVGDSRLILMAALLLADEIAEYEEKKDQSFQLDKINQNIEVYEKATKRILDVAEKLKK